MSLFRIEDGRLFVRSFFGYPTQQAAEEMAKLLWDEGYAVRVERIGALWHVWRSG
jgi:hypothetical protein